MTRCRTDTTTRKNARRIVSTIGTLPRELASDIMARVAADSLTDIINAKLSCKILNEIVEDPYVYRNVSLKKFSIVQSGWKPLRKEEITFLNKCSQYGNSELLYRKGVLDSFSGSQFDSASKFLVDASKCLVDAANSGHIGALYVIGIISLFGDSERKQMGINILSEIKKSRVLRKKLEHCRRSLREILHGIWIYNSPVKNHRPECCTQVDHPKQRACRPMEIEEQDTSCDGCIGDTELSFIFGWQFV